MQESVDSRVLGFGSSEASGRNRGMGSMTARIFKEIVRKEKKNRSTNGFVSSGHECRELDSSRSRKDMSMDPCDDYAEGRNGPEFMFDVGR